MLNELGLKKCVINEGEFEFLYSRFGEQYARGGDFGPALHDYDLILIIDTDLSFGDIENYMEDKINLVGIEAKTIDFYDTDGTTVITRLSNYGQVVDFFTDLVTYNGQSNYRGTLRFGKKIS